MTRKKDKKVTVGSGQAPATIILTAPQIGGVDIASYMRAIRDADRIDFPDRVRLYNLYIDLLNTDAHLNAVINKRRAALLDLPVVFRRNDRVDEAMQEHLRSPWFGNFILDILDAKLWGFSLFQFRRDGEWIDYDLIPRKHVDPVRRLIVRREQDITGDSWDEYADLLFVGKPRDLGLLAQVMPYAIYKRNCLGYFAQYTELFGQPLREGTYDIYNDEARRAMLRDLTAMGASGIFLHPEGTELKLHEASPKIRKCSALRDPAGLLRQRREQGSAGKHPHHANRRHRDAGTRNRTQERRGGHKPYGPTLRAERAELRHDGDFRRDGHRHRRRKIRIRTAQEHRPDGTNRYRPYTTGHGVAHRRRLSLRNLRRGTPGRLCRDEGTNVAKPRHGSHRGCRSISAKPHDTGILEPHARFFGSAPDRDAGASGW